MTTGMHTVNLANKLLDTLSNTSFAAGTTLHAKLHTGDPGAAGTSNASAETTRKALSWAAAASGAKAIQATLPSWTAWAAGNETISHISVWDASTGGNVLYTFALTSSKAMTNGDTLNMTAHTFTLTPLMA